MNRLHYCLFFLFLSITASSHSQTGYLFIKKGYKKKRTYTEGDAIRLRLLDRSYIEGTITLLRNDTIFVNGLPVPCRSVKEVVLKRKPKQPFPDAKAMLMITGGSLLIAGGIAASKQAKPGDALVAGAVIGFAPVLVKHFGSRLIRIIPRGKFKIGKKFHLQVLDFYINHPNLKPF